MRINVEESMKAAFADAKEGADAKKLEALGELQSDLTEAIKNAIEKTPRYEAGEAFLECESCETKLYAVNREMALYERVQPSDFDPIAPQKEPASFSVACWSCQKTMKPTVSYGKRKEAASL